ncbi:phosphoinositide 5-phosphatase [Entamoeba marina]
MHHIEVCYKEDGVEFIHPNRSTLIMKYGDDKLSKQPLQGAVHHVSKYTELMGFLRIKNACSILDMDIYGAEELVMFPLLPPSHKTDSVKSELKEAQFIKKTLDDFNAYYSYNINVTLSLQQILSGTSETDDRFFWNNNMTKLLDDNPEWITIFVDGFIQTTQFNDITYTLFSRRDCTRTGLRFSSRGSDIAGNVSNFVETEQILQHNNKVSSFVQIRGTIPLIWKTNEEDTFRPKGKFFPTIFQETCIVNHFEKLHLLYGNITVLNLLDNRGAEKVLHDMFEFYLKIHQAIKVDYHAFDFHKECANNKYENVKYLIEKIKKKMSSYSFFSYDNNDHSVICKQTGVVRTNCIDCLDRTNVVQSAIGEVVLQWQIDELFPQQATRLQNKDDYNNIWANHANQMSFRYTKTNAMKTDYTRTGKRGFSGVLSDGMTSVQRTLISVKTNQYQKPQESLEFVLGKSFYVSEKEPCESVVLCVRKASKRNLSIKKEPLNPIHIHITNDYYIEYGIENDICHTIPLEHVVGCDMLNDPRMLLFYCKTTSLPKLIVVPEIFQSYQLAFHLNKQRTSTPAQLASLLPIPKQPPQQTIDYMTKPLPKVPKHTEIQLVTWNMSNQLLPPPDSLINTFVENIKSDVIVIVVNKCEYQESYFIGSYNAPYDLFQRIHQLLNIVVSPYRLVALHTTSQVAQCVFVKEGMYKRINNVEVSNVYVEKSKPQKFSKLKTKGSSILFNVNENSFAFLSLHSHVTSSIEDSVFVKTERNLFTGVQDVFITLFETPGTNGIPGFEHAVRKTSSFASHGIVYHRGIWDTIDIKSKTELSPSSTIVDDGIEKYLSTNPQQYSVATLIHPRDLIAPPFMDIPTLVVMCNIIQVLFESKCDKNYSITFMSKTLANVTTTTALVTKQREIVFSPTTLQLNRFSPEIIKRYWITAVINDKDDKEVGRFVIPMSFLIAYKKKEYEWKEKCNVYLQGHLVGTCNLDLSLSVQTKESNESSIAIL